MASALEDEGDRTPILRMRGISKRFPGVDALTRRFDHGPARRGARAGRRERRRQVDADEDPVGRLSGGRAARSGSRARRSSVPTPPRMIELGVAVIYQEMMLAPHLTVAENIFLGRLPRRPLRPRGLGGGREAEQPTIMARLGFRVDPRARLDTPQRRAAPDGGDRPRAVAQRPARDPRRAVRRARRRGARKLFDVIRRLVGGRRQLHLHLAPPAGGLRDLRPRDGAARRRGGRHARRRRGRPDVADPHDGRPARSPTSIPARDAPAGRGRARRCAASPGRACCTTSTSTSAPARSSASAAWPDPGAPSCCGR